MKILVTHLRPDFDAISSLWLIVTYLPGWSKAEFKFVPAGKTLDDLPADSQPDIIHVDTGLGKFDHHQISKRLSAAKLVFDFLQSKNHLPFKDLPALERFVEFVTLIDNFGECYFPEPTADRYDFLLPQLIEGYKIVNPEDEKIVQFGFECIKAAVQTLKNKIRAENDIRQGFIFQSRFGKSLAIESENDESVKLALKEGYKLVIRKDPKRGFARFKTQPSNNYDLSPLFNTCKKMDPRATWFLHASKNMLLNGSSKNPQAVATNLSLGSLIEIAQKI